MSGTQVISERESTHRPAFQLRIELDAIYARCEHCGVEFVVPGRQTWFITRHHSCHLIPRKPATV